jgi:hypothetical protein
MIGQNKYFRVKFLVVLAVVLAGSAAVFYFQPFASKPCVKPITYSLGTFDSKFGLTQTQFLADVNQAAAIWNRSIDKKLFEYSANAELKINLVYDYRQQATDKLRSLGLTIDDSESSYKALKARYDSSALDYDARKQSLAAATGIYEKQRQAYEQTVNYWNSQGGAPQNIVNQLNQQRDSLNVQAGRMTQAQAEINALADSINSLVSILNRIGSELNKDVSMYNNVGTSRGQEFEEGLYQENSSGQSIDIYEFDSTDKLIRVLAHELGHALGLDHVSDPQAIMYRINQGSGEQLTVDDLTALKQVCGVK